MINRGNMRVLHIFSNPHLTHGASIFEYRISNILKQNDIYFDYLVTEDATEEEKKRYESMGSRLFKLPIDKKHGLILRELKINRQYYKFFKENHYDIVYADTENSLRAIHLFMARLAGIPIRVVHSHNTGLQTESKASKIISRFIRGFFKFSATDYFACSDMAAEWLFPKSIYQKKRYQILKNGVDLDQFSYNESKRAEIRTTLGISDEFVIGHVGRYMPQKNHDFLCDIFYELFQLDPTAKLLLIGDGPLKSEIEDKLKNLGIVKNVIMIDQVSNVNDYMQAMDLFLMPSLFEGLPITGIEAQAAGLPCLFSESITRELAISNLVQFMSLSENAMEWAKKTMALKGQIRKKTDEQLKKKGYSISATANLLYAFYLSKDVNV